MSLILSLFAGFFIFMIAAIIETLINPPCDPEQNTEPQDPDELRARYGWDD